MSKWTAIVGDFKNSALAHFDIILSSIHRGPAHVCSYTLDISKDNNTYMNRDTPFNQNIRSHSIDRDMDTTTHETRTPLHVSGHYLWSIH